MSTEKIKLPPDVINDMAELQQTTDADVAARAHAWNTLSRTIASYGKAEREKAIRECLQIVIGAYAITSDPRDMIAAKLESLLTPETPEPTALETGMEKFHARDYGSLTGDELHAVLEHFKAEEGLEGKQDQSTDSSNMPKMKRGQPMPYEIPADDPEAKLRRISDIMDMEDGELLKAAKANQIDFVWCAAHLRCALIKAELAK